MCGCACVEMHVCSSNCIPCSFSRITITAAIVRALALVEHVCMYVCIYSGCRNASFLDDHCWGIVRSVQMHACTHDHMWTHVGGSKQFPSWKDHLTKKKKNPHGIATTSAQAHAFIHETCVYIQMQQIASCTGWWFQGLWFQHELLYPCQVNACMCTRVRVHAYKPSANLALWTLHDCVALLSYSPTIVTCVHAHKCMYMGHTYTLVPRWRKQTLWTFHDCRGLVIRDARECHIHTYIYTYE